MNLFEAGSAKMVTLTPLAVVRFLFVVQMPHVRPAGHGRFWTNRLPPGSVLEWRAGEVIRVILRHIILYRAPVGGPLGRASTYRHHGSLLSCVSNKLIHPRLHALLSHVQYNGLAARDLNGFSRPVSQNGAHERRHVGDRAARGIGLVFAHDPEALLAAIIPA
jgi:hypothetical protein